MNKKQIITEADALRDILDWSSQRPTWQRDALRRLVVQGELTDDDIDELTLLCKDNSLANEPLEKKHITGQRSGAPTVSLTKICKVQNVNALVENQSLTFNSKGVTIIYGDNGTGKSGYFRVLKHACRARTTQGKKEQIFQNVYNMEPQKQQHALLEFQAGSQSHSADWNIEEPANDLLSEISVFDSKTANVHVEEENDPAYTPFPMKLLERLAKACKAIQDKIESEIVSIKKLTPKSLSEPICLPNTRTGKLIETLSKDIKEEDVTELATLSDSEKARFEKLTSDFSQDPKKTSSMLFTQSAKLEAWRTKLEKLATACSPDSGQRLKMLSDDLNTKKEAATVAAIDFSKKEPLSGIGSSTWRQLWEAARAYSLEEAYQEECFPYTEEDAHCVLCQQELGQNAKTRLHRFEKFVQNRTQQDEKTARATLEEFCHDLENRKLLGELRNVISFISKEMGNEKLGFEVREFVLKAQWRLRAMLISKSDVEHTMPVLSDTSLDSVIADVKSRAEALLARDQSDKQKRLRTELAELKDRQWLASTKNDVLAEIARLKSIGKLEMALKGTKTNSITSKSSELSEALVTELLRARFATEIDSLGLTDPKIELVRVMSQQGVSRFKITLSRTEQNNAKDVLSEGEHRCVALAGFMAELATNNSDSGIIFDDPVSSLDHLYREAIAKRLAIEGRKRQVIVFTHDLPFLFLLRKTCKDVLPKTEIALRHVYKLKNEPGYCRNEAPEKAKNALSSLESIRNHLNNTRIHYDQGPEGSEWRNNSLGLVNNLRQTWEAAAAEVISPVLRKFSSKVNTKEFAKLTSITLEDAQDLQHHFDSLSSILHKSADEMNRSTPKPEEIEKEIDFLDGWLKKITLRQHDIVKD